MRLTIAENAVELGEKAADFAAKMINQYIARRNRARVVLSADASQFEFLDALAKKEVDWSKVEFFPLNEYVGLPIDHPASFRQCIKERFAVRPEAVHSVSPEGNAEESLAALTEKLNEAPIDLAFVDVGENGRIALNAPPADLDCEDAYIIVGQAVSMTVKQIMRAKTILSAVPHAVKAQAIKATLEAKETTPLVPATVLKERGWSLYIDKNSASLIDPDEYILKEEDLPRRELAPEDGHYFFGYYDLQPYDSKGKRHLCHKVRFADRLPEADDIAELGYIDLETESFHKIAETTAWNC